MKVFVSGGGTGGHLFPAIALGEELVQRGFDIHLITDTRCSNYIKDCKLKTHILYLGFHRKSIISKILLSARMIHGILKAIILLTFYRPQLVVGFGGYTSFPALVAAKLLFIPIMLHEQNCFLGKVNDMFARSAVKLALNFAETANLPDNIKDKIVVTGTPVRKELRLNASKKDKAKLKDSTINLLVIGGSQAAQVFSEIIPAAIEIVHNKASDIKINITQQAKSETIESLRNKYKLVTNSAVIEDFFYDLVELYNSADLAISRSGASTIAELINTGTPAIMIPFPGAAEDHQTYNAKVLVSKNAGWLYAQNELTPEILADKIIDIARNPEELQKISSRLLKLVIPSERILGDTVEKIING